MRQPLMPIAKSVLIAAVLATVLAAPVGAVTVHTWVDEQGVTHFADAPPGGAQPSNEVEVDEGPTKGRAEDDYYSIVNQWQRLRAEREAQDALALERDRLGRALPAWLLLAAVVGLNLGLVYLLVLLNEWNNAFYNSLQDKNFDAFKAQLAKFAVIAFIYIAVAVYQIYLRQLLQIRWRRWLTGVFLQDWLAHRCYYRIELRNQGTDNPDQRIQEDLQTFTEGTLALALPVATFTTGLIIGAAAGALLGRALDGGRSRTLGTILGGAGGALLGREIDRGGLRCR